MEETSTHHTLVDHSGLYGFNRKALLPPSEKQTDLQNVNQNKGELDIPFVNKTCTGTIKGNLQNFYISSDEDLKRSNELLSQLK